MTSLKQKIIAGGAAALVAVGGGVAVAKVGTGDSASASPGMMGGGPPGSQSGGRMGGGGPGAQDLSALAKDLGVSTTKLQTAMQSLMQGGRPSQGGQDDMAAKLAKALGLSESKVEAALEANRPSGAPGGQNGQSGQTPPSSSGSGTTTAPTT